MIASVMYYIVYNPYWNAPDHLVRKIAQNYLSMGDKYLRSRGYQVMQDWTAASAVVPALSPAALAVVAAKHAATIVARVAARPAKRKRFMSPSFWEPGRIGLHPRLSSWQTPTAYPAPTGPNRGKKGGRPFRRPSSARTTTGGGPPPQD